MITNGHVPATPAIPLPAGHPQVWPQLVASLVVAERHQTPSGPMVRITTYTPTGVQVILVSMDAARGILSDLTEAVTGIVMP